MTNSQDTCVYEVAILLRLHSFVFLTINASFQVYSLAYFHFSAIILELGEVLWLATTFLVK